MHRALRPVIRRAGRGPDARPPLPIPRAQGANFEPASQALAGGAGGFRRVMVFPLAEGACGDEAALASARRALAAAIDASADLLTRAACEAAAAAGSAWKMSGMAPLASGELGVDGRHVVVTLTASYEEVFKAFDAAPAVARFFEEAALFAPTPSLDLCFSLEGAEVAVGRGEFALAP